MAVCTPNTLARGAQIGLVTLSADLDYADQDVVSRFRAIGVNVPIRLWAGGTHWVDLDTGTVGPLTLAMRESVAVQIVIKGLAQPAPSREGFADSLVGDDAPVAALLPYAYAAPAASTTHVEAMFALDRLTALHSTGVRLQEADTARLLVAMESLPIRDQLWNDMNSENSTAYVALWSDLTRRAPEAVRARCWRSAAGSRGRAPSLGALDRVRKGQPYPAADLMTAVVPHGVHPKRWEAIKSALAGDGRAQALAQIVPEAKPWPVPPLARDLRQVMYNEYRRHPSPRSQIEQLLTRLAGRRRDLPAPRQVDVIPDVQVSTDPGDT